MTLVCHVISQEHLIKGSCDFMDGTPSSLTVSHQPIKSDGNSHCGSGDVLVAVETSRCYRFNLPLVFISRGHSVHQDIKLPQKHHLLFLAKPPTLNQETVQALFFRQSFSILAFREPPLPLRFFRELLKY